MWNELLTPGFAFHILESRQKERKTKWTAGIHRLTGWILELSLPKETWNIRTARSMEGGDTL